MVSGQQSAISNYTYTNSLYLIQLSFTMPAVLITAITTSAIIISAMLFYIVSLLEYNSNKMISLTINFLIILSKKLKFI